jgi:hypothetical protein
MVDFNGDISAIIWKHSPFSSHIDPFMQFDDRVIGFHEDLLCICNADPTGAQRQYLTITMTNLEASFIGLKA